MPPVEIRPIPEDSHLFRRIRPDQVIFDDNLKRLRPSSAAFKDPNMSVDIEAFMAEFGLSASFCLRDTPGYSLARISAQFAVANGQTVEHKPVEGNPVHGEVIGKKKGSVSGKLAEHAEWEVLNSPTPNS